MARRHYAIAACALGALVAVVAARPDKPDVPPADALPAGAVARIGSGGFRHGGTVVHLSYTRDGKAIYSTSPAEKGARGWEVANGRVLKTFAPDAGVDAVIALGDGHRIATADRRKSVRLWDATTGQELRRLREPTEVGGPNIALEFEGTKLHMLAASADGNTLVGMYAGENVVRVWDTTTGTERATLQGGGAGYTSIDLSANGKLVVVGTQGGAVSAYDAATGQAGQTFNGFTEPILAVAVSHEGKFVAALGSREGLRVWDMATGKEVLRDAMPSATGALTFAPNSARLAVAWAEVDADFRFKPGGKLVLLDVPAGQKKTTVEGVFERFVALAFSPDGKTLAAGGNGNTVRFYDTATAKPRETLDGHAGAMTTVGISPDGKLLLTCSANDPVVRLWDARTGREVRRFEGNAGGVDEVQYSPDGRLVASAAQDRPVHIWEAATGKLVQTLAGHPSIGTHIRFSADGSRIVTGNTKSRVAAVWDVASGKRLTEYATPPRGISGIFTFDEGAIWCLEVAADADEPDEARAITLFDLVESKVVRRFTGHEQAISGIGVSADRRSVASHGRDGTVRVWEVATGDQRQQFHEEGEHSIWIGTQFVAFNPDGRTVTTCAMVEPVAKVWNLATGQLHKTLAGHRGMVGAVDFSANGHWLVTGSQDTTCLVWNFDALRPASKATPLKSEEIARHWETLRERDATRAYRAAWELIGGGATSVDAIREHLKPAKPAAASAIARWIEELDATKYAVRERATASLIGVLDQAEGTLRRVLATTNSAEVRQRVKLILDWPRLRESRAVEILETLGSREAKALLDEISRGPDGSLLTREAKAALKRLTARRAVAP